MIAVNLWKASQLHLVPEFSRASLQWRSVKMSENPVPRRFRTNTPHFSSSHFHKLSPAFATLVHSAFSREKRRKTLRRNAAAQKLNKDRFVREKSYCSASINRVMT